MVHDDVGAKYNGGKHTRCMAKEKESAAEVFRRAAKTIVHASAVERGDGMVIVIGRKGHTRRRPAAASVVAWLRNAATGLVGRAQTRVGVQIGGREEEASASRSSSL